MASEFIQIIRVAVDEDFHPEQWRSLPHDFPPWKTVYSFYSRAEKSGLWDEILQFPVEITRQIEDRDAHPAYEIIDSQSVKTISAARKGGLLEVKK